MTEQPYVVIIGAGELGQAIGKLLQSNERSFDFWDADPARIKNGKSIEEIVPRADAVFLCVPSWAMRAASASVAPFLKKESFVVAFSKGIEERTLKTAGELLPDLLPPGQPCAIAGGPMLAEEISAGKIAIGIFASKDDSTLKNLHSLFKNPRFAVETSSDMASVSLASVLKNIYAVALGVADGLGLSGNEKGWITSLAIQEMLGIAKLLGAEQKIILGNAGIGDFIATGFSPYSRNREVGDEIAKNGTCNLRGEGLVSLPFLTQRLGEKSEAFPLLNLVKEVGIDCKPAEPAFSAFFGKWV